MLKADIVARLVVDVPVAMVLIEERLLVDASLTTPPTTREQVGERLFERLVEDRVHYWVDRARCVTQPTEYFEEPPINVSTVIPTQSHCKVDAEERRPAHDEDGEHCAQHLQE